MIINLSSTRSPPQPNPTQCLMGYGLWVMGTNSAYAREGSVVIVHWPLPVRFGTSVTPSGKVVPMKKHRHSCKYSAAVDLKVWFARGAIELPGKEST